jgi:hypothetical protein
MELKGVYSEGERLFWAIHFSGDERIIKDVPQNLHLQGYVQ